MLQGSTITYEWNTFFKMISILPPPPPRASIIPPPPPGSMVISDEAGSVNPPVPAPTDD